MVALVDDGNNVADGAARFLIVADLNIGKPDFDANFRTRQVEFFAGGGHEVFLFVDMAARVELRHVALELAVRELHGVVLGDHAVEYVGSVLGLHQMDLVRTDIQPDDVALAAKLGALDDDLVFSYLHGDFE